MYELQIQPRDNQKEILKFLFNHFKKHKHINGILQAAPGTGKTFMSIYFGQIFNKILIIVPKNVLVDQWIKAFLQFTDLTENDIGIIEGSDIKNIQENIDKKVIITKPQSLISQIKRIKYYDLINLYSEVDFVIFDECHGAGAEGFSKALSIFKTVNILGLTATPFRRGINEFLLKNSIGDVLIEAEAKVLTPEIYFRYLPNDYIKFSESEIKKILQQPEYPMKLAFFNMFLEKKINYIEHVTEWIKWARDQDREIVILFSTNKLGKKLLNFLEAKYPQLEEEILFLTGNSKKDSLEIAKIKNRELRLELKLFKEELDQKVKNKELKRKEATEIYKKKREEIKELQEINLKRAMDLYDEKIRESKIIISNFSLLREGFDKPLLSTVIFGSPVIGKIPVIQSLGRITRLADKPQPLALFLIPEAFLRINPNVFKILQNNIKSTYPDAKVSYV